MSAPMSNAANVIAMDWALGLCRSPQTTRINRDVAGAGAEPTLLVVADGMFGYGTGWLAARLAVHVIFERLGKGDSSARYIGAADGYPAEWGWPGADPSREAVQRLYDLCAADLGERAALPRDLAGLFAEIGRVAENFEKHERWLNGLGIGCTAAVVEGARVRGTHCGVGRALVLRAGAAQLESLTVEHYVHLLPGRLSVDANRIPIEQIPKGIICGYLGLRKQTDWIDRFDVELQAGDVLLLCSRRLNITEDIVAGLIREGLRDGVPLDALARIIEGRSAETVSSEGVARDVAFVLARARASAAPVRLS